ncbi:MAG TPA: MFS transporter [Rhizomicrobium sp.]|jgi:MFS family permease|nr:MFS transporter [Rhizomicrobium sp.]
MRAALAAVWAVILTTGIVQAANGLQTDLLGVRAGLEAFPPWSIGVIMAGYYVGYSSGPILCPAIIRRIGHVWTIAGGLLIAAVVIVAHGLFVSPIVWTALRAVAGVALSCVYVSFESWIHERAENRVRGRVFSLYMVSQMVGMTGSQYLFTTANPKTLTLFLMAAAIFVVGALPVIAARAAAPHHAPPEPFGLVRLLRISPLGATETFLSGISWSAVFTFGPVYAQHAGLRANQIAWFMGAAMVGGAALQFPLGWLSDRIGRRQTMALMCAGGAASALFGIWADGHGLPFQYATSVLIGGLVFPLYSLSVAHANDKIDAQLRVPAAAGLVLLFGLGSILGPLAAGGAMSWLGPSGYYGVLAAAMGLSLAAATVTR